jgi:bacillithiol biosynthesis deacetylase BshB1
MVFGAHPDDIEIGCGGIVAKLSERGRCVVLVDLTRGELGTRGTPSTRDDEAQEAMRILGAEARLNLDLPDGHIGTDDSAVRRVIDAVRQWGPALVLVPHADDRHPDHIAASDLAYRGVFLAGLAKIESEHPPHRPTQLAYYPIWNAPAPTFVVDVTAEFDKKMASIDAYRSQFSLDSSAGPATRLTAPETRYGIEGRLAYYGSLVGVRYGEGLVARGVLCVEDPLTLPFTSF